MTGTEWEPTGSSARSDGRSGRGALPSQGGDVGTAWSHGRNDLSSALDAVFGGSVVAMKPLDSVFWRRVPRRSLGLSRMGVLVCSATMETPSAPPFMLQRLDPYLRPLFPTSAGWCHCEPESS